MPRSGRARLRLLAPSPRVTAVPAAGAVLAGGASRRMGADKAFVAVGGVPMVVKAVGALRTAGTEPTVVVGGNGPDLQKLGLGHVPDRYPGGGPLGGIITALSSLDAPLVMVLSCDLTAPSPQAVAAVLDHAAASEGVDVAAPVVGGRRQWLHAAWRPACLPVLEAAFARGARGPSQAAPELTVEAVPGPAGGWSPGDFHDADRPGDLPP